MSKRTVISNTDSNFIGVISDSLGNPSLPRGQDGKSYWDVQVMRASVLPRTNELRRIKAKAMRQGIWFKVLTRAERAQMELTMRIVKRIRSHFLAKVVIAITKKLWNAMESKVARLMGEVGHVLARKLSRIAQSWGNKSSVHWEADLSFVQYLAVSHMNTPAIFKL